MQTLSTLPATATAFATVIERLPFLAAWGNTPASEGEDTQSIGTSENEIIVNPSFMGGRTDEESAYMVAFICMMMTYSHLERRGDRNPALWEGACNMVINRDLLAQEFTGLPTGGLIVPGIGDATAEQVYDLMVKEDPMFGETMLIHIRQQLHGMSHPITADMLELIEQPQ